MKVLYAPLNFGDVIQDGVYDAFTQLGCELKVFDYMTKYLSSKNHFSVREELINECRKFRPNLILLQIQHTSILDGSTIRIIKSELPSTIIVNFTIDIRNYIPETYKDIAKISDFNLISSTGQIDFFEKNLGKSVKYWQIGYNPKLYFPQENQPTQFESDCVFIGHHNDKENYPGVHARLDACKILRKEFGNRFYLYGTRWPKELGSKGSLDQRTVSKAYYNSVCNISISHYNDVNDYFSDRLLMCLASGRPTIMLKYPHWENYFTDMCDLVVVSSIKDIPNKVRMLKSNPELANYIGMSGAAKVLAEHTYFSRIKELFNIVGLSNG